MVSNEEINRMRWAARRGMLELDLVLEPFVQMRYAGLDAADRDRFQALMRCEDQELFGWFLRREQPEDGELAAIVGKILDFTHTAPEDR
ncbi:succinate dehydrogenase assembly factor 2 [Pseudohalioglobus sediminis]|uniref:FAD assembly factor SdhE n=1 Tax=Pseudohalioglobus sediminis TaxID=2606449 RepID=A0A5B0X3S2_9GAMM|nr:succinate dehydrogenase assembly factor 2 [Pseudohalioglobus sediminis]KAA1193355.1 succinate dehydrogenase assembly factor 2 [Pseudohalioglobus sediminis]